MTSRGRKKPYRASKAPVDTLNKVMEPVQLLNSTVSNQFTTINQSSKSSNRKARKTNKSNKSNRNAWRKDKDNNEIIPTTNINPWTKNTKVSFI